MKKSLLLFNLKLNRLIFSTSLNSSLIIFIRTYIVNYRNALDRLRVRMDIILFSYIGLIREIVLFSAAINKKETVSAKMVLAKNLGCKLRPNLCR